MKGTITSLSRRHRQAGLTLIEIIVVLIILGLLFSTFAGGLFKQGDKAKARINDIKISKLKQLIGQYQLERSALPASLQDLGFIAEPEDLNDAWGTPFTYSAGNGNSYTVKSLGADKKDGGTGADADVVKAGP